jgi:hypothetical protein
MLYLGSCRYMYDYDWDYFPGRLHTTREIIFFLENMTNIKNIINNNPPELANCIFGDIYHPGVINDANKFMNKNMNTNINKIIMEISSKKVMYYNDIPLNYFYTNIRNIHYIGKKYNLVEKILTDKEVEHDLNHIIKLCKTRFNENIQLHIIPHLNLKTKAKLDYICDRNNFVNLLECLCSKYNIKIHNIGKYIEDNNSSCFLEDYMPDSTHYSNYYDKIKAFLIGEIIGIGIKLTNTHSLGKKILYIPTT